jgi:hypothetical protein
MPRKMIRLARGAKCGFLGSSRLLSAVPWLAHGLAAQGVSAAWAANPAKAM